jgi:hypothetical protein
MLASDDSLSLYQDGTQIVSLNRLDHNTCAAAVKDP